MTMTRRHITIWMLVAVGLFIFSVLPCWAADVEITPGIPVQKSLRHHYVTGTSGAVSTSVSPPTMGVKIWELISLEVKLSGAGGAANLTATRNSALGAVYDTVLFTQDMTSITSLSEEFEPGQMIMVSGDTLDIAWANGSNRTYGIVVKYRLK